MKGTNFRKVAIFFIAAACLLSQNQSNATYMPNNTLNKGIAVMATFATVGIGGYALYTYCKNKAAFLYENRIIDETSSRIVLALTTNARILTLPKSQQEAPLRKKAHMINMRKRIMVKLTQADYKALSDTHRTTLEQRIKDANDFFTQVDLMRNIFYINPYEKEYVSASTLDIVIENNIIDSIILNAKPDHECSQEELNKKDAMTKRKQKIITKVGNKLGAFWAKLLMNSDVGFPVIAG